MPALIVLLGPTVVILITVMLVLVRACVLGPQSPPPPLEPPVASLYLKYAYSHIAYFQLCNYSLWYIETQGGSDAKWFAALVL